MQGETVAQTEIVMRPCPPYALIHWRRSMVFSPESREKRWFKSREHSLARVVESASAARKTEAALMPLVVRSKPDR